MFKTNLSKTIILACLFSVVWNSSSVNADSPSTFRKQSFTWTKHSSGIRTYNFIDVYRCTLYLAGKNKPSKSGLFSDFKTRKFPVSLRIQILTSMLPDKMPETWRQTIESEVTGKAFHRFQKGFASLDEGDVLLFLFLPDQGTRLLLNDKQVFHDPGPGLMQSLLEQWIGPQPISEDLKEYLVGE